MGKANGNGNNNSTNKKASNMCRKHDGAHKWKDKGNNEAVKSNKKAKSNLHAAQTSEPTKE